MLDDESTDAPIADDDIVSRAVRNIAEMGGEDPTPEEASPTTDDPMPQAADSENSQASETDNDPFATSDEPGVDETPADAPYATDDGFADDTPTAEAESVEDASDDPFAAAGDAAREAQRSIRDGIQAFKNVYEASQRHQSARNLLNDMRVQLEADTAELQHRIDIEQSYPQIVSEQTAAINEASQLSEQALQRAAALDTERNQLESQLATTKKRNEEKLRPYRNVAESTKGRADDTASTLADVKRAIKSAETSLADATKRRDQRLASANRAVDNAEERLRRVQADLDDARAEEPVDEEVIARLEGELASEQAHLNAAKADIPGVTEELRQAVEGAQQSLFRQKKVLEQAERDAEVAKKEAAQRRAEYDEMLKRAQDAEQALNDQIKQCVSGAEDARSQAKDAQARMEAAQEILDEAEKIHATPQQTIALRDQIAHEQAEFDRQQDAVDELAAAERALRKGTFKQRLILILGGVGIVLLAIAIAVGIFMARNAKPAPTATKPQTEATQTNKTDDKDTKKDESADAKKDTDAAQQKETESSSSKETEKTDSTSKETDAAQQKETTSKESDSTDSTAKDTDKGTIGSDTAKPNAGDSTDGKITSNGTRIGPSTNEVGKGTNNTSTKK